MKVSIIGAGNVGGLTAMRLLEAGVDDLVLVMSYPAWPKAKPLI